LYVNNPAGNTITRTTNRIAIFPLCIFMFTPSEIILFDI
jgi:hypothetical protein